MTIDPYERAEQMRAEREEDTRAAFIELGTEGSRASNAFIEANRDRLTCFNYCASGGKAMSVVRIMTAHAIKTGTSMRDLFDSLEASVAFAVLDDLSSMEGDAELERCGIPALIGAP